MAQRAEEGKMGFIHAMFHRIQHAVAPVRMYKCFSCQFCFISNLIEIRCPKCKSSGIEEIH